MEKQLTSVNLYYPHIMYNMYDLFKIKINNLLHIYHNRLALLIQRFNYNKFD